MVGTSSASEISAPASESAGLVQLCSALRGRSVCDLAATLATRGRASFLHWLKEEGLLRLGERQALCNALSAAARKGTLPSPTADELKSRLSKIVCRTISGCCRIFAIADVHTEYPFNQETLEELLKRTKRTRSEIDPGCDVCICCGSTSSPQMTTSDTLRILRITFRILRSHFDEVPRREPNALALHPRLSPVRSELTLANCAGGLRVGRTRAASGCHGEGPR